MCLFPLASSEHWFQLPSMVPLASHHCGTQQKQESALQPEWRLPMSTMVPPQGNRGPQSIHAYPVVPCPTHQTHREGWVDGMVL